MNATTTTADVDIDKFCTICKKTCGHWAKEHNAVFGSKINLDKMKNYVKENPTSDDTNLKRVNAIKEIEAKKAKEQVERTNKLVDRRLRVDKKIDKMKKEIGL